MFGEGFFWFIKPNPVARNRVYSSHYTVIGNLLHGFYRLSGLRPAAALVSSGAVLGARMNWILSQRIQWEWSVRGFL